MAVKIFNRITALCLVLWCFSGCVAQNKSTNIQTIAGKKFYIHKIEKKQSLYSISKLYGVPLDTLYRLNPGLSAGAKANQEIRVPLMESPVPGTSSVTPFQVDTLKYKTYRVQKGETVYSLSRKFGLSEKQLLAYNPGLSQGLQEGQLIITGEKKKKNRDHRHAGPDYEVKQQGPPGVMDSSLLRPVYKPAKESYNLALILPFRLDEMGAVDPNQLARSNTPFPAVPALSVDFYLGFKKAVDSLAGEGFKLNLQLYDVDEDDTAKLSALVNDPQFGNLDFIFGPVYASGIKKLSRKSAELHIPVVSPITQQNKILYNNIHVSKTNPSQFTLLESLADYCMDSLMKEKANIILVWFSDKDRRETAYVSAFRNYFGQRRQLLMRPESDSLRTAFGFNGMKNAFVPGMKNIVVTLSPNQVYITDFTTQLAMFANNKDITLCGWQNVTEMDNIDQEYLNQLGYTFPHQFNISNTAGLKPVLKYYTEEQATFPGEYYFIGFDVAYYYLKNLKAHGPDFANRLNEFPMETAYMRFNYTRPDTITGFDNRGVYIFRYNNYQLEKTGWK